MTFEELILKVLKEEKRAISADEIWEIAVGKGYDKQLGSKGKTPVATLSALIYKNIGDLKDKSPFVKASYRPTFFYLKEYDHLIDKSTFKENPKYKASFEVENTNNQKIEKPAKQSQAKSQKVFSEKDLHPFLVYYANLYLKCFCKTIRHQTSDKNEFGDWQHPDIVGCRFPIDEWKNPEVFELSSSMGENSSKLFSFELKKKLDFSNLRSAFFQSVSNSSWASEGYLVAAEILGSEEFLNELKRLSSSFGIGIIRLNIDDPDASEIIFPAKTKDSLDWETIHKLSAMNNDFKEFLKRIKNDFERKEVIQERYDKVLDKEKLIATIK